MSAIPKSVVSHDINPGQTPTTQVTYQCDSLEDALREVHRVSETYENVDAEYKRETGELVLVFR
jgi:hypothetical protein